MFNLQDKQDLYLFQQKFSSSCQRDSDDLLYSQSTPIYYSTTQSEVYQMVEGQQLESVMIQIDSLSKTIKSNKRSKNQKKPQAEKTKLISKPKKLNDEKSSKLTAKVLAKKSTKSTKSQFNNFGGFLIGTIKDIQKHFGQIKKNNLLILEYDQKQCLPIQFDQSIDIELIRKVLYQLKLQLDKIGSKEGDKKSLLKILNSNENSNENEEFPIIKNMLFKNDDPQKMQIYMRISKQIFRKELIFVLDSENWIFEHAKQRQFKPTDDKDGSKKKQRQQSYCLYLQQIKNSLITNKGLESRNKPQPQPPSTSTSKSKIPAKK